MVKYDQGFGKEIVNLSEEMPENRTPSVLPHFNFKCKSVAENRSEGHRFESGRQKVVVDRSYRKKRTTTPY